MELDQLFRKPLMKERTVVYFEEKRGFLHGEEEQLCSLGSTSVARHLVVWTPIGLYNGPLGSDLRGRFQEIIIGCSASRELRRCRI